MRICVGISGSIAAYRSVDFVKKLIQANHEVRCVLTQGGKEFVSTRALETISGFQVLDPDLFDRSHFGTDHISTARWSEIFVIFGGSANFIGRLAAGLGDDFLSLQLLAFEGPVIIAPAMNPVMWKNPMVVQNVKSLLNCGYQFVGPVFGQVSCGETGVGHIASDDEIIEKIRKSICTKEALRGLYQKRVLISAGPMRTHLDPVRFIQNRSSGKMGFALADACRKAGALSVTVLLGPVVTEMAEQYLKFFKVFRYEGFRDYSEALELLFPDCDVFFSAAAVLDFEAMAPEKKMDRSHFQDQTELSIRIKAVPDIVAYLSSRKKSNQQVIAFAAESGTEVEIIERANKKMNKKQVDAVIANPLWKGFGPESDQNQVWVIRQNQPMLKFGPANKTELCDTIISSLFKNESGDTLP